VVFPFAAPATGACTIVAQDLEPDLLDEEAAELLDAIIDEGSNVVKQINGGESKTV
jgi:hypothetical protein